MPSNHPPGRPRTAGKSSSLRTAASPTAALSRPSELLTTEEWGAIVRALALSSREGEVARCILDDKSDAAIGTRLEISRHTVHTHMERLHRKLGASTRPHVVARLFAAYIVLVRGESGKATADSGTRERI